MIDESAVSKQIAPSDEMLGSALDLEHYFRCGHSALECIENALVAASIPPSRIQRILDLPCGHGRVLRYLRAAFPDAKIAACDILREGVDFCSSVFGATPIYSCDEPETIPLKPGSFDLIWVGSLFTHLDAPLWLKFLSAIRNALAPGGLLIFSTHGRAAYQRMAGGTWSHLLSHTRLTQLLYRYERTGFAYVKYPGSDSYYGFSLSHPAWVIRQLTSFGGLRLVNVSERAWDDFHDIFATVRERDDAGDLPRTSHARYFRRVALDRMNPHLRALIERTWAAWRQQ